MSIKLWFCWYPQHVCSVLLTEIIKNSFDQTNYDWFYLNLRYPIAVTPVNTMLDNITIDGYFVTLLPHLTMIEWRKWKHCSDFLPIKELLQIAKDQVTEIIHELHCDGDAMELTPRLGRSVSSGRFHFSNDLAWWGLGQFSWLGIFTRQQRQHWCEYLSLNSNDDISDLMKGLSLLL